MTTADSISTRPDTSELWLRCPACGGDDQIAVHYLSWGLVQLNSGDPVDEYPEATVFPDHGDCRCDACGHSAKTADFRKTLKPDSEEKR